MVFHSSPWRLKAIALAPLVFGLTLVACEGECSVSTARLTDGAMASAIDPASKAPTAKASSFAPNAGTIYATVKLSAAPADTKVKAAIHYLESGDREVVSDEVSADGTRMVAFTLSSPDAGWPAGQYETRFLLNGKEVLRTPFNVAGTTPTAAPAAAPVASAESNKVFRDDKFGMTFEVPSTWNYHVDAAKNYVIEGVKGTDAYEISLVLQFVIKAANPKSSATAQAQRLVDQITAQPNSAIKSHDMVKMGGQDAPYFVATYAAADSAGRKVPFSHAQVVLDHGDYYYLISYSAPAPIYEKYLGAFQHMVETFRFIK